MPSWRRASRSRTAWFASANASSNRLSFAAWCAFPIVAATSGASTFID